MTTPGSNNLAQALSIQGKQTIFYYEADGRSTNDEGIRVSAYKPPVMAQGAFQPMPRQMVVQLGLDLNKEHGWLYLSRNMKDVARGTQGDQFTYAGRRWQLLSSIDWFSQDQWMSVICADQGLEPNTFYKLGEFEDPGATDSSVVVLDPASLENGNCVFIEIPRWTFGAGTITPAVFGPGLNDGDIINIDLTISDIPFGDQDITVVGGSAEATLFGSGEMAYDILVVIKSDSSPTTGPITLSRGV